MQRDTPSGRVDSEATPVPAESAAIWSSVWAALVRGKADRRHPFHLPTLCTRMVDGSPTGRVVVLRHAREDVGELGCHTDARSPKVQEIAAYPVVSWVLYDAAARVQIRASGTAQVLRTGPEADAAWAGTGLDGRRCYLAPGAPSEVCEEASPNLPEGVRGRRPTWEESAAGRENFAVVRCRLNRVEWLHLGANGHRRAAFARGAEGDWGFCWVLP